MKIKQYEIWIAGLYPRIVTEAGKTRPVLIIQTDLLNKFHPSTIMCPTRTNVKPAAEILRIHLVNGTCNLKENCDSKIDSIPSIGNKRLLKKIGELRQQEIDIVKTNLSIILDN